MEGQESQMVKEKEKREREGEGRGTNRRGQRDGKCSPPGEVE